MGSSKRGFYKPNKRKVKHNRVAETKGKRYRRAKLINPIRNKRRSK